MSKYRILFGILNLSQFFATISTMEIKTDKDAMTYLSQYGYIKNMDFAFRSEPPTNGIMMFQKFAGLQETGKIDNDTMQKMNMPRCGNKERMDILVNEQIRPNKDIINGWRYSDIHYKIRNFPRSGLSPAIVRQNVRKAFKFWEQVADITSIEVGPSDNRHVEVDISFEKNDHGDGFVFGETEIGQAVAHAFFPKLGHNLEGDIHFDNQRGWTVKTKDGINFFQICVHEIGHALGLKHSMIQDSVMHMLVKSSYDPNFKLHEDDIKGIRNLYGRKTSATQTLGASQTFKSKIRMNYNLPKSTFFRKPSVRYTNQINNRLFGHSFQYFRFKDQNFRS